MLPLISSAIARRVVMQAKACLANAGAGTQGGVTAGGSWVPLARG